jgi:hypothetical protein
MCPYSPLLGKSVAMPVPLLASDPISASVGGLTRANTRMLPLSSCEIHRQGARAQTHVSSMSSSLCQAY